MEPGQKRFLADIFLYTFFGAIEKVLPFLILPYLTRVFSVESVGYYTLYQSIIVLLIPAITCEVGTTISINFFHYDKKTFAKSVYNGCLSCIGILVLSVIIMAVLGVQISSVIKFPQRELWLSIFTVPFMFINDNLATLYRNQNKPVAYGVFSSLRSLVCYGIGLMLIYNTSLTWNAFVVGNLTGNIILSFWSIKHYVSGGYIEPQYDRELLVENIKVGFPVSLHIVGSWMSNSLNQLMINVFVGIAATGLYGVGATFGMIMSFIQTSLNKAYSPILYRNISNKKYEDNRKMIRLLYLIIISSFSIIVVAGYFSVGLVFGDSYMETRMFIFPLVLTSALQGLYKIHSAFLFYYKKTMSITKITLTLGALNIPLSYIILKSFGISGIAYSSVIVWAISYMLIYREARKCIIINQLDGRCI